MARPHRHPVGASWPGAQPGGAGAGRRKPYNAGADASEVAAFTTDATAINDFLGGVPVLGVSQASGNPIIVGASGGTITNPTGPAAVPEPVTLTVLLTGLVGLGVMRSRRAG